MSSQNLLPHLLKLLDDESTETQAALAQQFAVFGGDISDELAALAYPLSAKDRNRLSGFLKPGKRSYLEKNWVVPSNLEEDWEGFEHLLRLISDFIHDGITLRPSIHDSLDLLADEVDQKVTELSPNKLRKFLFSNNLFTGARKNYYSLQHSDLGYALQTGKGNPITLCMIFQLVAQRLDQEVSASNYPGHFLSRIRLSGADHLVDCFNGGRLIPVQELEENKQISRKAKFAIHREASPRVILFRILSNVENSLLQTEATEDALLVKRLCSSLLK
jgi:hypothetical protein